MGVSALGRPTALPPPPRKRRFNIVFAAEPTKAANRDPQRSAGVLIAFVHPRNALDLLSAKSFVHQGILLVGVRDLSRLLAKGVPLFCDVHNLFVNNQIQLRGA